MARIISIYRRHYTCHFKKTKREEKNSKGIYAGRLLICQVPNILCEIMNNLRMTYYVALLGIITIITGVSGASGFTFPNAILHYANISISNSQSSATVNGLQVMISFNALAYQQYEANSLNNTEFFYTNNGTVVPSWMEGNQLDWYQPANTLYTSQNVIFWIKYGPSIAAHTTATNTIAIGFGTKTTNLLNKIDTGEAPQLSCANPSNTILCDYGEYDDGSSVFNQYWNFSYSNSWYKGGAGYGPKGIEYSDNGLRVQGWTFDNVAGVTAPGNIITVLVNATAYSSTPNTWAEALSLSNTSSGNGLGAFPGIGTISGTYTYSPYIYLYNYEYVPHMQSGSNITDLKAPHTISIGFNDSGEINYTSINYRNGMGSETSNMLLFFQSGYYNGPLRISDIACSNLTLTSAKAELAVNRIMCTGTIDNEGQIRGLTPSSGCNGNSAAGYNGAACGAIPDSFGGSGGAGGGNVLLSLTGGNGANTLIGGGLGSTGIGQNGATPAAPSVVDAANVAKWGNAPLTYLQSGGGGSGANGGSGGDGTSTGTFIESNRVIAGSINETSLYKAGSGAGGSGGGALLIAYGNGGYTAGNYDLSGALGGSAGTSWAAGGNGGAGQLITYSYGSNAMPISVSFPKQTETYPILSSMVGNASFYYMYSRHMPPLSIMPSVSFSSARLTPSCTVFITNPSNTIIDIGQYENFVVTEDNCTGPYTYNILISNSITPSVITHNDLLTGQTANSVSYIFQTISADTSNSPEEANIVITDSSPTTVNSLYSSTFTINPVLSIPSITPTNPTIDSGQSITLSSSWSGGTPDYTVKWYAGPSGNTCSQDSSNVLATYSSVSVTSNSITVSPTSANSYCIGVTDSATTPETQLSSNDVVFVNAALGTPNLAASNTPTVDTGQYEAFSSSWTGGTLPYTANYLVFNTVTDALVANALYTGITGTSNTFLWFVPTADAGNTISANVFIIDSASNPVTVNSIQLSIITISLSTTTSTTSSTTLTTTVAPSGSGGGSGSGGVIIHPPSTSVSSTSTSSTTSTSISTSTSTSSASTTSSISTISTSSTSTSITSTSSIKPSTTIAPIVVSKSVSVSGTSAGKVNFTMYNITVEVSTSNEIPKNVTISFYRPTNITTSPYNYENIYSFYLNSSSAEVKMNVTIGYNCRYGTGVVPFAFENDTWNQIYNYIILQNPCRITFPATNDREVGLFVYSPSMQSTAVSTSIATTIAQKSPSYNTSYYYLAISVIILLIVIVYLIIKNRNKRK